MSGSDQETQNARSFRHNGLCNLDSISYDAAAKPFQRELSKRATALMTDPNVQ